MKKALPEVGTQKGDVYSYGIVIQELVLEDEPYPEERLTLDCQSKLAYIDFIYQNTGISPRSKQNFKPPVMSLFSI